MATNVSHGPAEIQNEDACNCGSGRDFRKATIQSTVLPFCELALSSQPTSMMIEMRAA